MTTAILCILTVFLSVSCAVLGLALVQQRVPSALREAHNDVAGFIYAVLGVMYAVVLAFVAIAVWEDFEEANNVTHTEANNLADIYGLADQFPEPKRSRVQGLVRSYAQTVLDEEWALMQDGQSSPQAQALMNDIHQSIEEFEPNSAAEQVIYAQQLSRAEDLADARALRLVEINEGIPSCSAWHLADRRNNYGRLHLPLWAEEYLVASDDGRGIDGDRRFHPLCDQFSGTSLQRQCSRDSRRVRVDAAQALGALLLMDGHEAELPARC